MVKTAFSYHTIQSPAEGLYKEKGSKFLAFAYPVETEQDISENLNRLRKDYYDASHHCYAYRLGADHLKFRAFDDGEPNHTAGDPILGQIKARNITNVLVVVVRYFGGTKLGVGGLINAYKTAAEEVLKKAVILEKDVLKKLSIMYNYASTPEVMRLVKEFDLTIKDQSFESLCSLNADYKLKHEEKLLEKVALLKTLGHII